MPDDLTPPTPSLSRRLATILCADVVGYSRLVGVAEDDTLRRLEEARALVGAIVARHGGRIFNVAGDSILAEFPSAVGAVQAAVEIQDRLRAWNDDVAPSRRMLFRIGLNLGDVIVHGSDLLGEGVNVAARMESLAPPGGICLSGAVHEQVRAKLPVGFDDLGLQPVKNIADPVRVFRVRFAGEPAAMPPPLPGQPAATARGAIPPPMRKIVERGAIFAIVLGGLVAVNLLDDPYDLWVQWPALGMGIAFAIYLVRTLVRIDAGEPADPPCDRPSRKRGRHAHSQESRG